MRQDVQIIQDAIEDQPISSSRPTKRRKTQHSPQGVRGDRSSSYTTSLTQQCNIVAKEHRAHSSESSQLRQKLQTMRDEVSAYRRETRMLAREETKLRSVYNSAKTTMEDKKHRVGQLRKTLESQLEEVRKSLVTEQTLTETSGTKLLEIQNLDKELRSKTLRVSSLESEIEKLKTQLKLYQRGPSSPPLHLPPLPQLPSPSDGAAAPSTPQGDQPQIPECPPDCDDTLSVFVHQLTRRERRLHAQLEQVNRYRTEHQQSKNRANAIDHQLKESRIQAQKLQHETGLVRAKLLRMEKEHEGLREANREYERKLKSSLDSLRHEKEGLCLIERKKRIADERASLAEKRVKEVLLQVETYASGLNSLQSQFNAMKAKYDQFRRERDQKQRQLHGDKHPPREVVTQEQLEEIQAQLDEAFREKKRAETAEREALRKLSNTEKSHASQGSELKSIRGERNRLRKTVRASNDTLTQKQDSMSKRITAMEKIIVVQAEANNCLLEEIHNMNQQIKEAERQFLDKKQEIEEFKRQEDARFKKELSQAMGLAGAKGSYRHATPPNGGTPRSSTAGQSEGEGRENPSPPGHPPRPERSPPGRHANGTTLNHKHNSGDPTLLTNHQRKGSVVPNAKAKPWGRQYSYQSDYAAAPRRNGL